MFGCTTSVRRRNCRNLNSPQYKTSSSDSSKCKNKMLDVHKNQSPSPLDPLQQQQLELESSLQSLEEELEDSLQLNFEDIANIAIEAANFLEDSFSSFQDIQDMQDEEGLGLEMVDAIVTNFDLSISINNHDLSGHRHYQPIKKKGKGKKLKEARSKGEKMGMGGVDTFSVTFSPPTSTSLGKGKAPAGSGGSCSSIIKKDVPRKRKVQFKKAEDLVEVIEFEDDDESKQNRRLYWEFFAVDRFRFKDLISRIDSTLGPIFKPEHRAKIYMERFLPHLQEDQDQSQSQSHALLAEEPSTSGNAGFRCPFPFVDIPSCSSTSTPSTLSTLSTEEELSPNPKTKGNDPNWPQEEEESMAQKRRRRKRQRHRKNKNKAN